MQLLMLLLLFLLNCSFPVTPPGHFASGGAQLITSKHAPACRDLIVDDVLVGSVTKKRVKFGN